MTFNPIRLKKFKLRLRTINKIFFLKFFIRLATKKPTPILIVI